MSINDCHTMCIDVIYFDFSNAFDSVNHDIILHKLKHIYKLDGRLLEFIKIISVTGNNVLLLMASSHL